jgi:uncharacterized protein YhjY with autotransporter beta-barrel domain
MGQPRRRSALPKALWLPVVFLASGLSAASAQSLLGDTVNTTFNLPNQTTVNINGGNQAVAPTANYSFFSPNETQNITVAPTTIRLVDTTGIGYAGAAFNGYVITDLTAARIRNATIDPSTNFTGFNASRLSFTADSVALNLQSLEPLAAGQQVVIDLSFFSSPLTPLLPPGAPINAVNVAGGIDNFTNNGGTLPQGFANLFNLAGFQLVNALLQLDGEVSTDAERAAFQLMNEFLGLMLDPYVDGRFGSGTSSFAPDREASLPPDIAMAYASVLKAPPKVVDNGWSVWGTGFGGSSHANGDPTIGSSDVTANTYGFASGADYHFTRDTLVGFALAGAGTNWGLSQFLGSGRSDAFQAGVYGKTAWGPIYLAAALAYTNNWFTTNRFALGDQLTAKFNGESFGGRLESGYRFVVPSSAGQWEISPYGAIQAQSFHTPSYSETDLSGLGLGLNFNSMNATDTRSELGARFADLTAVNGMPLILRARLAWAHDWVDDPALNAAFQALPGSSFIVNGAPIPSDSALASVGAELHMTTHWSALAKFDGEFARNSQTYAGTGTLRYTW